MNTSTTHTETAATPEAVSEKTYPWVGLLLIVASAALAYGGLAAVLL